MIPEAFKIRNGKSSKKNTALATMLLLITLLATSSYAFEIESSKRMIFLQGEGDSIELEVPFNIDVDQSVTSNAELTILSLNKLYKYSGDFNDSISLTLKSNGVHKIELINKSNRQVIDWIDIVLDPETTLEQNSTSQEPVQEMHEDGEEEQVETNRKIIKIDKATYYVGETVLAQVELPANLENARLYYESEGNSQRYMGELSLVIITPKKPGIHSLSLQTANGNEIERAYFEVIDRPANLQESIPKEKNASAVPAGAQANTPGTILLTRDKRAAQAIALEKDRRAINKTLEEKRLSRMLRIKTSKGQLRDSDSIITAKRTFIENQIENQETLDVNILVGTRNIERIQLYGLDINSSNNLTLGIDDIPHEKLAMDSQVVKKAFAIDPSGLDFINGTVTSTAAGRELWKCKDWNFITQTCQGTWEKIKDIIPGLSYTIDLNPADPGFMETGLSTINTDKPAYLIGQNATITAVVLDTQGFLVANANVTITVTSPGNITQSFSIQDASITQVEPGIYQAHYTSVNTEGNYTMSVSAVLIDGTSYVNNTMISHFSAFTSLDFDIIREMPVTIDPFTGPFNASIRIMPLNENITHYNATEIVPAEVEIMQAQGAAIATEDNNTYIKWTNLTSESTLNYTARAPLITPNLLIFGRLIIEYAVNGVAKLFEEARSWFIAVDPTPTRDSGLIVYADSTAGVPKFRNWTGTTLQAEQSSGLDFGNALRFQKFRCLEQETQCILLNSDSGSDINFAIYYTNNATWGNSQQLDASSLDDEQNFDVECEDLSGDCLIAYEDSTNNENTLTYRTWDGTTLSSTNTATVTSGASLDFRWVILYPKKNSDIIGIVVQNDAGGSANNPDIYAGIWNGNSFDNWTTLTLDSMSTGAGNNDRTLYSHFDCAWDGDGIFNCFYSTNGQSWLNLSQFNGTTWRHRGSIYNGTTSEISQIAACGLEPWHSFNHTKVGVMMCDASNDIDGGVWNGTSFSKSTSSDAPSESTNGECYANMAEAARTRTFECRWEKSGNQAVFTWVNSGNDFVSAGTYTTSTESFSIASFAAGTQVVTDGAADLRSLLLVPSADSDKLFLTYQDASNDAGCSIWSGTSWSGTGCNNAQVFESQGPSANVRWMAFDWFRVPPAQPDLVIIEPNGTTSIKSFFGIISPSSSHKAYTGSTTQLPPTGATAPILGTQFTSQQYVNVSASDDAKTSSLVTVSGGLRVYQSFNFTVTESTTSMTSFKITHEGYATSGTAQSASAFNFYIYNWSADTYDLVRSVLPSAVDTTTEIEITGGFNDYVRARSMLVLVEGSFATGNGASARAELITDYIDLTVNNYALISSTINVNATAQDDDGINFCEWAIYNSTIAVTNLTRMNDLGNNFYYNTSSIEQITDGLYNLILFCNDTTTSRTNQTEIIYIDNTDPAIRLYTPINASNITVNYALFSWNVTDILFENLFCNITMDGSVSQSNILSVHGENTTKNVTGISDGTHYWNITCVDDAGNKNTSETRMFDLDTKAPAVIQTYPAAGTYSNLNPIDLNFTATDVHTIINCTLRLNGQINGTIFNITSGSTYNFTFANLLERTYWWNVTCIDSFGFSNTSTNKNFTADRTNPTIFLNTTNNALFNGTTPSLNYTVIDNIDTRMTCNITVNGVVSDTNIASPNNTMMNRNISMIDGFKSWNVTCADDAGNINTSETRIFNVISGPLVVLYSPQNGTVTNGYNLSLRYTPSDGNGIANCSLFIDGILNQTNISAVNNANNTFALTDLAEGRHSWQVSCYDTSNTQGSSSESIIFSDRTAPAISLVYPSAGLTITTTPQQFNFTMTDSISTTATCNLTIDSTVAAGNTNFAVQNSSLTSKSQSIFNGLHWWNVTCYDLAGNFNTSQTRNFTVNVTVPMITTVVADKSSYFEGEVAIVNITTRNDTNGLTSTNITLDYVFTNITFSDTPWWDTSWLYRKPIYLSESQGLARNGKPIVINITFPYGTLTSCTNELRIIADDTLTPVQFAVLAGDDVSYCYLVFNATVSANAANENNYHIYFNNSAATDPGYSSPLDAVQIYFDGFGGASVSANWTVSTGWDISSGNPLTGNHAHIQGTVTDATINLTTGLNVTSILLSYDEVNVSFSWAINGNWDGGEILRYDLHNGSTGWIQIDALNGGSGAISETVTINLNSTYRTQRFNIRFRATNNNANEDGGFDNYNVTAYNTVQQNVSASTGAEQMWISRITAQTNTTGQYNTTFDTLGRIYGNYSAVVLAKSNSLTTRDGSGYDWFAIVPDTAGPSITLLYPSNPSTLRTGNHSFIYTAVDAANDIANCTLIINGSTIQTNSTVNETTNNSFIVNNMGEGQYNWSILCFDELGSNSTGGPSTLYLDDTPPVITAISPNETTVQTGMVSFTFNAADNFDTSIFCNITADGNASRSTTTSVASGSNATVQINITQGLHYWNVTCFDNINNTGFSQTLNFSAADIPVVKLHSPANGFGFNSTGIILYYNLSSNNINNCTLILNDSAYSTFNASEIQYTSNDGQNNFTIEGLGYSKYNWTVNCYDTNGFNGSDTTRTFYLDNAAPNITLNNPANGTTLFATVVRFNFTIIDVDDVLVCNLTINNIVNRSNFNAGSGSQNLVNVTGFSVGNYSWNVTCFDNAGFFATSETRDFTIDSNVSISLVSPANGTFDADGSLQFSYIPQSPADFALGFCELYLDGASVSTEVALTAGNQYSFTRNGITSGEHSWYINCTDSAAVRGISETRQFIVDTIAPTVVALSPNATFFTSSSVFFNWTALDNFAPTLSCSVNINGTVQAPSVTINNNTIGNATYSSITDGLLFWNVTCADGGGLNGVSSLLNFTVQEIPVVALNSPADLFRTRNVNLTFLFTPTDNSGFLRNCTLILDGIRNQTNTTQSTSGTQKSIYSYGLLEGTHNWNVNCSDPSGNTAESATSRSFTIDMTAPNVTVLYPLEGGFLNVNDVPFSWNATDYDGITLSCQLFVDHAYNTTVSAVSGANFTATVLNRTEGYHNWSVNCSDDLGNSMMSSTYNFTINSPDLYINQSMIFINSTNPTLYDQVQLQANVTNIGGIPASNVLVEFWDGPPVTGIFIGNATANINVGATSLFTANWNITPGYHTIWAVIDRFTTVVELNDSNNNASLNISVIFANITFPANATIVNTTNTSINFTATDYTSGSINYTVLVDGVVHGVSGIIPTGSNVMFNLTGLSEGVRRLNIQARDALNRTKNSSAIYIIVDYTAPTATINTANQTWFNYSAPQINITSTDAVDSTINYVLFVNGSVNATGTASSGVATLVNLSSYPDGLYNIILQVTDDANNTRNSSSTFIYIDTIRPYFTLNSPANNSNFTTGSVTFNFTAFDNLANFLMCNISVDGTTYGGINATNGVATASTLSGFSEGTHYWNVSCRDQAGNTNTSETRIFNIFKAPAITLVSPANNTITANTSLFLLFNATDDTGLENCSLILNGAINQTKITSQLVNGGISNFSVSGLNGTYAWAVTCYDNTSLKVQNTSVTWQFIVDIDAPQPIILTFNQTWFNNNSPQITFNITDNADTNITYAVFVNSLINATGDVANASLGTGTLTGIIPDGTYSIIVRGTDDAGNQQNSTPIIIYIDTTVPSIVQLAPTAGESFNATSLQFNFTASDNMASYLMCNLTVTGGFSELNINVTNGSLNTINKTSFTSGLYFWNVTCYDIASNRNTTSTFNFTINSPDLLVTSANVSFNTSTYEEGQNITIYANVQNIGGVSALNVTVQFWRGNPQSGGVQINGNLTIASLGPMQNATVNVSYAPIIGINNIYVEVDPRTWTNGSFQEENETNNQANKTFEVGLYQVFAGNLSGIIEIEKQSINLTLFNWSVATTNGSYVFRRRHRV